MLATSEKMLQDAQAGGYAIGAFNVENLEMIEAVLDAAEEMGCPVILQTTPGTLKFNDIACLHACARAYADKMKTAIALHLDHGDSFSLAMRALRTGYTSVMIDGSLLRLTDNISLTKQVVDIAKPMGVPVEAELGQVGGKEDAGGAEGAGLAGLTDPDEAADFARKTGCDSLAVAIGTAHGLYHGAPVLDKDRLARIRGKVEIPLVLHGASGLSDGDIRDCIERGICKVNFATELRLAFSEGVRQAPAANPDTFDPKAYLKPAREKVKKLVMEKLLVLGMR